MSASGYVAPSTLDQAIHFLAQTGAQPLAGGQALLLQAHRARLNGVVLVDLSKVKELSGISLQSDGSLQIGAMTTLDALHRDSLVSAQYPALAAAANEIGDAQLRNRATVGGTLADADPESDLAALLLALGAEVQVRSGAASRPVPLDRLFAADTKTTLAQGELITSLSVPAAAGVTLSYQRSKHPATLSALCGVAACAARSAAGEVSSIRVAATGALAFPTRLKTVEDALQGKTPNAESISKAAASVPNGMTFRSDLFGSGDYRRHLLQVLTRRVLTQALS